MPMKSENKLNRWFATTPNIPSRPRVHSW